MPFPIYVNQLSSGTFEEWLKHILSILNDAGIETSLSFHSGIIVASGSAIISVGNHDNIYIPKVERLFDIHQQVLKSTEELAVFLCKQISKIDKRIFCSCYHSKIAIYYYSSQMTVEIDLSKYDVAANQSI